MAGSHEIPSYGSSNDILLPWLLEAVSEGEAWLGAQRPTTEWDKVLDSLGPDMAAMPVDGLSNVGYDKVERNFRDIVASLANFRHDGEYKARWNKELYDRAHILTKLDRHWYRESNAHDKQRANLQYAAALGTGYLYEDYDRDEQEIRLTAVNPANVTFLQLPADHDIQKAYAVIIKEEVPINLARREYPFFASRFVADRDAPGWLMKGLRKLQRLMGGSPALRVAGNSGRKQTGSFPTVDIFKMYTLDNAVNEKPVPVTMGTHGTNWSYKVPVLGSAIPTGRMVPGTQTPETRSATAKDCRLFPYRRYTVFTRTFTIYDGSSPWWHGQVPLARTLFNDLAWEALGRSMLAAPNKLQEGIVALMRYIEDSCAARLDPPYIYDDQKASEGFAKSFDPRKAGSRAGANLDAGDLIKFPVPYQLYDVPAVIPEWIKQQEARLDNQMGTPDLVAVAKAKQVPGEGTLEKLIEMAGPLVQDLMRQLERPLWQLGTWRLAYYFQFYSRSKVIQVAGPSEDETDAMEFGPDDPRGMHDEVFNPDQLVPPIEGEQPDAKIERARRYFNEFKYVITESGVHEMYRMVNRLALLQLRKAGLPIDWWTIGKSFKLSNLGPEPEGTHNMFERWVAEQHITRELAEELQGGPAGQGPGRPPTNKKAPQLKGKDGGSRQTITTS
jgi:hypothetical protein